MEPPSASDATGPAQQALLVTNVLGEAAPSPVALPAGARVGKYELIRVLGRGGMGIVYLARDVVLGRRVAIKFMLDARAVFVERFHAEARATAKFQHESIVVIHELGDFHGYGFMVLEYLEGETLAAVVATGAQPARRAIELVIPVARALVHAHAAGVVHLDLKPENVFVTVDGAVKVLDFGIARAGEATDVAPGVIAGTPLYMAPEQRRGERVDHRADIWAFGLVLHELISGRHPLGPEPSRGAIALLADQDTAVPSALRDDPSVTTDVVAIVERCVAKDPAARFPTAAALLEALMAAGSARRARAGEASPYPGLGAFADGDADVFFGRAADVRRGLARLREHPLVAVLGPSGVGKSSFVRAGLGAAVTATGDEVLVARPGRDPLRGLAALVGAADEDAVVDRLRAEPGYLAEVLRARAQRARRQLLLVVDQFEELYTLPTAVEDRAAYAACLAAIADDVAAPLRVVLAMRSDFLDRIAESTELTGLVSRGLMFLSPLDRGGLRDALVHPARVAGYAFESDELVDDILDALEHAPGALPLLQFIAGKLWDARDRQAKRLTDEAYRAMGGVAGAIAAHADQVVSELSPAGQREARALFQRLVTPERTRAIAPFRELTESHALIDTLVRARLLVVTGEGDERNVEIVHDSLIVSWPKLAAWIEDEKELGAFAAELRSAAKQWDDRGRPVGLVWRGEVLALARRQRTRLAERGALPARERAFLDAAIALDERALRLRRRLVIAALVLFAAIAAGATVAMVYIRNAQDEALHHARNATAEANRRLEAVKAAELEAARAAQAEAARGTEAGKREVAEQQAMAATQEAQTANSEVAERDRDLAAANARLQGALDEAKREAARAKAAQSTAEREAGNAQRAEDEVRAKQRALEQLLAEREARLKQLEDRLRKISTELK